MGIFCLIIKCLVVKSNDNDQKYLSHCIQVYFFVLHNRHDITEILLKVALNIRTLTPGITYPINISETNKLALLWWIILKL